MQKETFPPVQYFCWISLITAPGNKIRRETGTRSRIVVVTNLTMELSSPGSTLWKQCGSICTWTSKPVESLELSLMGYCSRKQCGVGVRQTVKVCV